MTQGAAVLRRRSPDQTLVLAQGRGDEAAFAELVDRHHGSLVGVAQIYVRDQSIAEELAQETWLIVLNGLDGFEGRSSLKTWIFSILVNRAKTRGARERRQIPISALSDCDQPSVAPDRFFPPDHPPHPRQWKLAPQPWPEERLLMREKVELVRAAVETLPPTQRIVLGLRDVEGWTAQEVCQALKLTTGEIRAGPVRSTPDDCHGCTTYLKQFRQTIRLTGALRDEQIDPGAREELLAAFRDWSSS